jgi:hypothetical protein
MNDKPWDEIEYSQRGQFTTLAIPFASQIIFTAHTSRISEETENFWVCPNCETIQFGYQRLAVEKAHATDVIG